VIRITPEIAMWLAVAKLLVAASVTVGYAIRRLIRELRK
jgi:hypothetical protein